jgi:hypothetical protein
MKQMLGRRKQLVAVYLDYYLDYRINNHPIHTLL